MSSLLSNVAYTTSHRDRDDVDVAICRLFLRHLNVHSVTLLRLFDDGQMIQVTRKVAVSRAQGKQDIDSSVETTNLPALTDVAAWTECVNSNEVIHSYAENGRCVTHFPIPGERGIAGIVNIEAAAGLPSSDTDLVRDILLIVKNHLALLDYGEIDTLTGLLNRKTFESRFDKLRQRESRPVDSATVEFGWLALVDIDHFKSVNDRYGHLFGDEVLLLVSRLMQRTFRGADQLFRFGGEEFLVVLEKTADEGARIAFERLRSAVEDYEIPQVGRVTVSVGYTRVDPRDMSTTCVERADAALYFSKNHGRNSVHCYEALLTDGKVDAAQQSEDIELF